ncbi:hypothetical protein PISMIDRAFT_16919 [Pisolithus microcarpus 441]|uniref:Uncharacterized protein n=1 Tax=Pisolithus microcarpus 441 TaxID=765257 RepID=A0A0C9YEA2_9AGAM|nr:hypothetical protein PISMIDRAFT_16919 [Pisolithus microcarpus 441]
MAKDDYSLQVPTLNADGSNWLYYKARVEWAVGSKGLTGHLTSLEAKPEDPTHGKDPSWKPTTAEQKLISEYPEKLKQWTKDDGYIKQVIAASLPESLFLRVQKEETGKSIWDVLTNLFQNCSRVVTIDLRRKLQESRCTEKAALGQSISNDDFTAIILSSLPTSYDSNIAAMTSSALVTQKDLSPDFITKIILDEYDQRQTRSKRGNNGNSDDVAYSAKDSKSSACENCGKKGHTKDPCWKEGGRKAGQVPKWFKGKGTSKKKEKPSEKAATTTTAASASTAAQPSADAEPDGVWLASSADDDWLTEVAKEDIPSPSAITEDAKADLLKPSESTVDVESGLWKPLETVSEAENGPRKPSAPPSDVRYDIPNPSESTRGAEKAPHFLEVFPDEGDAYMETLDHVLLAGESPHLNEETILFNSGASRHMSSYRNKFLDYKPIIPKPITTADSHTFHAIRKGDLMISIPNGTIRRNIRLKDVLYAPKMGITLVSVSKLDATGYATLFRDKKCQVFDSRKKKLGEIPMTNGLYCLKRSRQIYASLVKATKPLTMAEIHARLGHIAPEAIRCMLKDGTITGITLNEAHSTMGACDSCEYAKATRKPIGKERDPPRQEHLGDEIHTDLWGPSPVQTPGHSQYYMSFTDDHTRYTTLYLQKMKSETFASYKAYKAWLQTQFSAKIKCLRSDRGGEYLSAEFTKHLKSAGTECRVTVHDTPEHNGVAERLNRTLIEWVCALIHASGLPKNLWGEAIMHATWLKNRSSTRCLGTKTPYKMLYHKPPNLTKIPVWGCHVKVHDNTGSKLDMRARDGYWVGFDPESDGHRIYWPDTRSIGIKRSVTFERREQLSGSTAAVFWNLGIHNFETPPPQPRRSNRQHFESDYLRHLREGEGTQDGRITLDYMKQLRENDSRTNSPNSRDNATLAFEEELAEDGNDSDLVYAMVARTSEAEGLDPSTVHEAKSRSDWSKWHDAIAVELKSLNDVHTWDVVECPKGANIVGCKWVFKIKRTATREVEKYKACLVAKGYSQVQGVDYDETYAPVTRLASLRTILAIAARNNWEIDVFNFHSAFLNGKLGNGEDIYMELPEGYPAPRNLSRPVAKLNVVLYGSKQGALRWYQDHVDDCTITSSSPDLICSFKAEIGTRYKITDLGPIGWLLGMKVTWNRDFRTISLSQESYINAILTKYNLADAKPSAIPMDPSLKLTQANVPQPAKEAACMKNVPYCAVVGSLMHLAVGTCPDIAFAVSTIAQFNNAPTPTHWEAVRQIYKYLVGTKSLALTFSRIEKGLEGL